MHKQKDLQKCEWASSNQMKVSRAKMDFLEKKEFFHKAVAQKFYLSFQPACLSYKFQICQLSESHKTNPTNKYLHALIDKDNYTCI